MKITAGQTAVITGAGSGIGQALAIECANRGMGVVAADIEVEAVRKTAAIIESKGGSCLATGVDVTKPEELVTLAELTWQSFGGCQLLCNNAGVSIEKPMDECSHSDWLWIMNVNLMGVANALTAFLPRLRQQRQAAHIVNTASMAGLVPLAMTGPYVASKYAVVGLSEVLKQELENTEIGVSILCPGAVETRIFESERNRPNHNETPLKQGMKLDDMGINLPEPYRRILDPGQVAEITLRAVCNNALYITTHPEWLPLFTRRSRAISNAFQHIQGQE